VATTQFENRVFKTDSKLKREREREKKTMLFIAKDQMENKY